MPFIPLDAKPLPFINPLEGKPLPFINPLEGKPFPFINPLDNKAANFNLDQKPTTFAIIDQKPFTLEQKPFVVPEVGIFHFRYYQVIYQTLCLAIGILYNVHCAISTTPKQEGMVYLKLLLSVN